MRARKAASNIRKNRKAIRNSWLPAEKVPSVPRCRTSPGKDCTSPSLQTVHMDFLHNVNLTSLGRMTPGSRRVSAVIVSPVDQNTTRDGGPGICKSTSPMSCRSDVHFYFACFFDTFPSQLCFPAELFTFKKSALTNYFFVESLSSQIFFFNCFLRKMGRHYKC